MHEYGDTQPELGHAGGCDSEFEDQLFNMLLEGDETEVKVSTIIRELASVGLRHTDARLQPMRDRIVNLKGTPRYKEVSLDRDSFIEVVRVSHDVLYPAFTMQLALSDFAGFITNMRSIFELCRDNTDGDVCQAEALCDVPPDKWGVAACSVDGQRLSLGDATQPFTLQSCVKAMTYAIALEELGAYCVHQFVGTEPCGRKHDDMMLDDERKPHNAMTNAGAILVSALLQVLANPGREPAEIFTDTQQFLRRMAGGEYVGFNQAVFLTKKNRSHRNYAIGFYLSELKCYPPRCRLSDVLDLYFQCCSMEMTCDSLCVAAATLANGGVCPTTGERLFGADVARDVLSMMRCCGVYDSSGDFAFKVGLPAKSGKTGVIMLVVPNVMGVAMWSPRVDACKISCRGFQFCCELTRRFNLRPYDGLRLPPQKSYLHSSLERYLSMPSAATLSAAARGDLGTLRRMYNAGADMTLTDADGRNALNVAAAHGRLDCLRFLVNVYGAKQRALSVPTAIDDAQFFGYVDVVNYLQKLPIEWQSPREEDTPVTVSRTARERVRKTASEKPPEAEPQPTPEANSEAIPEIILTAFPKATSLTEGDEE